MRQPIRLAAWYDGYGHGWRSLKRLESCLGSALLTYQTPAAEERMRTDVDQGAEQGPGGSGLRKGGVPATCHPRYIQEDQTTLSATYAATLMIDTKQVRAKAVPRKCQGIDLRLPHHRGRPAGAMRAPRLTPPCCSGGGLRTRCPREGSEWPLKFQ